MLFCTDLEQYLWCQRTRQQLSWQTWTGRTSHQWFNHLLYFQYYIDPQALIRISPDRFAKVHVSIWYHFHNSRPHIFSESELFFFSQMSETSLRCICCVLLQRKHVEPRTRPEFYWEGFIRKCWLNSSRNLVEVSICRNTLHPRELLLLKCYAEYRRMCLSPINKLAEMKSVPWHFRC